MVDPRQVRAARAVRVPALMLAAAAWLIAIAPALAVPPLPGPEIELYLTGATAQDESLENLMRSGADGQNRTNVCQAGTLDIYRGRVDGVGKRVFYCKTSGNIQGVRPGLRLAVHKSSGGSGEGVTPVSGSLPVTFLDLARLADVPSCREGRREMASGDLAEYVSRTGCDGPGRAVVPRAGLSDVEPELVGGVMKPLSVRTQNQLVWGLPVSKNLRNALQAAQGLVRANVPHDDPSRDTEAAMPNLTRAQVAGIFAGTLVRWQQFHDPSGAPLPASASLPATPPRDPDAGGATPGAYRPTAVGGEHPVYICRRIASSGSQAAYEVHYLRSRCVADAPPFVPPNDGSDIVAGGDATRLARVARPTGTVFAGVGTSDVRECLDAHEQYNRWAVGVLSTENRGNNGNREFRFVKVDGHAPTLINAHAGRWQHVTELSIQWLKSFEPSLSSTNEGRVLAFIASALGQPGVLRVINEGFVHPWGQGGYLAPARTAASASPTVVTADTLRTDPVAGVVRGVGRPSNCSEPTAVGNSPL